MVETDSPGLAPLFFTGTSRFLEANEHFVGALVGAAAKCAIHASEDILDANGLKLWARGQAIDQRLLERLSNRRLRKPIELCVYAADPIALAGIAEIVEARCASSGDLQAALAPDRESLIKVIRSIVPNPTELMLLSLMRHAERDMLDHAAMVAALSIAMAKIVDVPSDLLRPLARAALLHDVGELYLDPRLFRPQGYFSAQRMREIQLHPSLGAQVAVELSRSGALVSHLIGLSHERLDGWGYPRALKARDIPLAGQALLFAEAMVPLISAGANGLRRAAVAAHLVAGELPVPMVNWLVQCSRSRPIVRDPHMSHEKVWRDLRQLHAILSRVSARLASPNRDETTAVRAAAFQWQAALETLTQQLRGTGVEEVISIDGDADTGDEAELIELSVLRQELSWRIRTLGARVEQAVSESAELGGSPLVLELIEALKACEIRAGRARPGESTECMPWSRFYSLGIAEVDEQHRALVELLNRLAANASADTDAGQDRFREQLDRLLVATREHFSSEEQLMRRRQFAKLESHAAAHGEFLDNLSKHLPKAGARLTQAEREALVNHLRQWLIVHILHGDRELVPG